jgi:hypothetical protein
MFFFFIVFIFGASPPDCLYVYGQTAGTYSEVRDGFGVFSEKSAQRTG